MLASSGSSFSVALRCHHNLFSSSPSFAPSMPFSNAGSLQGHGSSKVAFPLIALQWLHLFLLLQSLSLWFSGLHFGSTSLSWVSGSLPHLSIVLLHLEVSKTPLDQIPFIFLTLVNKQSFLQLSKGGKKKAWFSTWLINFTANKNPFHFYLKHCPISLHSSPLPLLKSPCHVYALSCLTLCDPMNCSPPGSSVHGISQATILEWVDIPFSRESSWPRDWICVSWASCIGRQIFLSLYHSSLGHCKLTSGFWKQHSIFPPPLHPFFAHSAPSARV